MFKYLIFLFSIVSACHAKDSCSCHKIEFTPVIADTVMIENGRIHMLVLVHPLMNDDFYVAYIVKEGLDCGDIKNVIKTSIPMQYEMARLYFPDHIKSRKNYLYHEEYVGSFYEHMYRLFKISKFLFEHDCYNRDD